MPKNVALGALTAVLLVATSAGASTDAPDIPDHRAIDGASPEPLPTGGLAPREELEAFIDGVMSTQLRSQHVAGATLSIVKDGELFFAKGYGYENVATFMIAHLQDGALNYWNLLGYRVG